MQVSVGTFNLNNLFSRYNFRGEIEAFAAGDSTVATRYDFADPTKYKLRTFMGRLVKGKDPKEASHIAERILAMDLDVLAVQEVEDIETLKAFVKFSSSEPVDAWVFKVRGKSATFVRATGWALIDAQTGQVISADLLQTNG